MRARREGLVLGAGVSGLAVAQRLGRAGYLVHVVESADEIGGLAKTRRLSGSTAVCDLGMHALRETAARRLESFDDCLPVDFRQQCQLDGALVEYPYGLLRKPRFLVSAALAMATRPLAPGRERNSYDYLRRSYGRAVVDDVLDPMVRKWLGCSLASLSREWAVTRLKAPKLSRLVSRLGPPRANLYHYSQAYQPRHGIARTLEPLVRDVSGELHLESPVTVLETRGAHVVRVVAGEREFTPDVVVSTIPLTTLGRLLSGHAAFASLAHLEYRHVAFFLCRVQAERFRPSMLAYVPDPRYSFYRIGIPKSYWAEHCAAEELVVCAEVALRDGPDLHAAVVALEDRVVDEICAFYGFPRAAVLGVDTALQRHAYPVMSAAQEGLFLGLGHETALENLYLTGRTGQFKYWLVEECLNAADACAELVLARHGGGERATTA